MLPLCLQDSASMEEDVTLPQPSKTTPNLGAQVANNGPELPKSPMFLLLQPPFISLNVTVTQSYLPSPLAGLLTAMP